jgi:F0F1-type ATP synthase epsilon subunit
MQLSLITPTTKNVFDIAWIELNTPTGNYVIQPGHAPTIMALSPNKTLLYCLKSGKQEIVLIKNGFAQITRAQVTLVFTPMISI